jgi:hypothetical protein
VDSNSQNVRTKHKNLTICFFSTLFAIDKLYLGLQDNPYLMTQNGRMGCGMSLAMSASCFGRGFSEEGVGYA